jgi:8-oxo-dGTP pyrophosphatase MutT (NUDIX family)
MFEQITLTHHIQKHIMSTLMYVETARFRDMKPPRVDTNLYTYHLKLIVKSGLVKKVDGGYTLSPTGMSYVDRVSTEKKTIRTQPKIITMLVVQNSDGDVLLQKRSKQPYINEWTLPYGKLHIDDLSVVAAAKRETSEKLFLPDGQIEQAGDCYIRVWTNDELVSTTLAHVFRLYSDEVLISDSLCWIKPHKIQTLKLAPAVEEIMTRTFFKDSFYFEEFDVKRS